MLHTPRDLPMRCGPLFASGAVEADAFPALVDQMPPLQRGEQPIRHAIEDADAPDPRTVARMLSPHKWLTLSRHSPMIALPN